MEVLLSLRRGESDGADAAAAVRSGHGAGPGFKRSTSAKSLFDLGSSMRWGLGRGNGGDGEDDDNEEDPPAMTTRPSFRERTNYCSAGAFNALRGPRDNDVDLPDARAPTIGSRTSGSRTSGGGGGAGQRRRKSGAGGHGGPRGFLEGLAASLGNIHGPSGGASVASNDFGLGLDDDGVSEADDDLSAASGATGRSREFDDEVFNSLLSGDVYSAPCVDLTDDDDSSDARSGVFYPPPRGGAAGAATSSEDDISDARSGVFYPPGR